MDNISNHSFSIRSIVVAEERPHLTLVREEIKGQREVAQPGVMPIGLMHATDVLNGHLINISAAMKATDIHTLPIEQPEQLTRANRWTRRSPLYMQLPLPFLMHATYFGGCIAVDALPLMGTSL